LKGGAVNFPIRTIGCAAAGEMLEDGVLAHTETLGQLPRRVAVEISRQEIVYFAFGKANLRLARCSLMRSLWGCFP
jgi:hypothetical protein